MTMNVVEGPINQTGIDRREARALLMASELADKTPAQVDAWVDANVTDLASAREALKKIIKYEIALAIVAT